MNRWRRTLCALMVLVMLFTLMPVSLSSAQVTTGNWDDFVSPVTEVGGIYPITTAEELAWIAQQINSMGNSFAGKTIRLAADLDLELHEWIPIGKAYDFAGTFDGAGHTISGMVVRNTDGYRAGFFGGVGYGAVKDLTLQGVDVESTFFDVTTNNGANVGGLTGVVFDSPVSGCTVTGAVRDLGNASSSGGTVGGLAGSVINPLSVLTNCHADVAVTSMAKHSGGFAGFMAFGHIDGCTATGTLTSQRSAAGEFGGMVGHTESGTNAIVTGCTASVAVIAQSADQAGGFVGVHESQRVEWCVALGSVTGGASSGGFAGEINANAVAESCLASGSVVGTAAGMTGGFVGKSETSTYTLEMHNCYATGSVTTGVCAGGFAGRVAAEAGRYINIGSCYATGQVSGAATMGGFAGYAQGLSSPCCFWLSTSAAVGIGEMATGNAGITPVGKTNVELADYGLPATLNVQPVKPWKTIVGVNNGYPVLDGVGAGATIAPTIRFLDGADVTREYLNIQALSGTPFALPAAVQKSGFLFTGWFLTETGEVAAYNPYNVITDTALYAHWNVDPATLNQPPVAPDVTLSGVEDVMLETNFSSYATDPDFDVMTIAVSNVTHGIAVTYDLMTVRFTPETDYNGSEAGFDYTVTDSGGLSDTGHADITLTAVNDAPRTSGAIPELAMTENGTLDIAVGALGIASDPEGDVFWIESCSASKGTLAKEENTLRMTYTPAADDYGTRTIEYTLTDGTATSGTLLLRVSINPSVPRHLVSGTVTWRDTGEPANGIYVQLYGEDEPINGAATYGSPTNMSGVYNHLEVKAGRYRAVVMEASDGLYDTVSSAVVDVTADVTDLNLVLDRRSLAIGGRVVAGSDVPASVEGLTVSLYACADLSAPLVTAITVADGSFVFTGTWRPGAYLAEVAADSGGLYRRSGCGIDLYKTNVTDAVLELKPVMADWSTVAVQPSADPADAGILLITTPQELAWVAVQVNSGVSSFDGMTLELMNDLDLAGRLWLPIGMNADTGSASGWFQGCFNGNGHRISHMTIDLFMNGKVVGLFGGVQAGTGTGIHDLLLEAAAVDNLGAMYSALLIGCVQGASGKTVPVEGCRVAGTIHQVNGIMSAMGGLVGFASEATIEQCDVTLSFDGSALVCGGLTGAFLSGGIRESHVDAVNITNRALGFFMPPMVGGLVGYASESTIERCCTEGELAQTKRYGYAGGLFGNVQDVIVSDCFTTVNLTGGTAGGFVGMSTAGTMTRCYAAGVAAGTEAAAGFVGLADMQDGLPETLTQFVDCYWNKTAYDPAGMSDAQAVAMTTVEMADAAFLALLDGTPARSIWVQHAGVNQGFPVLEGIGPGTATPNQLPTALPGTATTEEDLPVDIDLTTLVGDADGDPLNVVLTETLHGTGTVEGLTVRFTPETGYNGDGAAFTYLVSDGKGGTASATVTISVIRFVPIPTSVTITGPDIAYIRSYNTTASYTATVLDQRGGAMEDQTVAWQLVAPVANVRVNTRTGVLTIGYRAAAGPVALKAVCGVAFGEKIVTLAKFISVRSVSLDQTFLTLAVDESTVLHASINPSNATDPAVTWLSSSPGVLSVSQDGKLAALKSGMGIVVVQTHDGGRIATCLVNVIAKRIPVSSVMLSPRTATLRQGRTLSLMAIVEPWNATNRKVVWSSDNTAVATVSTNGRVTAVGSGTARITVRTEEGGFEQLCVITVVRR